MFDLLPRTELDYAEAVRRTRARATWAIVGIAAVCVLRALELVTFVRTWMELDAASAEDGYAAHIVFSRWAANAGWVSMIIPFVWFASGILFLMWVHAAHKSAKLLRPYRSGVASPASAVWGYFIPIVSLIRPYKDMRELADISDPRDLPVPVQRVDNPAPGYRDAPTREVKGATWVPPPLFIGVWWGAYAVMSMLGMGQGMITTWQAVEAASIGVWHDALFLMTGGFCVAVVRGITNLQVERARRLKLADEHVG